jgi:hypothetical protein
MGVSFITESWEPEETIDELVSQADGVSPTRCKDSIRTVSLMRGTNHSLFLFEGQTLVLDRGQIG